MKSMKRPSSYMKKAGCNYSAQSCLRRPCRGPNF